MKSLRRSLNKDSHTHSPVVSGPMQLPSLGKPVPATAPPSKVIRALQPYRSNGPQELSFSKGDFFHVFRDMGDWYEAHNPMTGSRGLVPRSYFEEFSNGGQPSRLSAPGTGSAPMAGPISPPLATAHAGAKPIARAPPGPGRLRTFYAIVQYDFTAERPDELDARAGEPLTVVAQSNREWFVAKPIGRLGGAGLIPAAFVEIRDPSTGKPIEDVDKLIERGDLPRVEEWKRRTSEYKASSIPLGVLDDPAPPLPQGRGGGVSDQSTPPALDHSSGASSLEGDRRQSQEIMLLPPGQVVYASVPSFHFENKEYWFRINARYAPYPPHERAPAPPERDLVLYRVYDDFYDFQIALLDALPVEAGRQTPNGSPIPAPEPNQPPPDRLLPYMPGPLNYVDDSITTIRCKELDEYVGNLCDLANRNGAHVLSHPLVCKFFSPRPGDIMDEMPVEPGQALAAGSDATQRPDLADQFSQMDVRTHSGSHSRTHSRAQSQSQQSHTYSHSRSQSQAGRYSEYDGTNGTNSQLMSPPLPTASTGTNGAGGGGSGPNPAFIKVKIFSRSTDDLIAIRVPPNVTHRQLMNKVRERLDRDVAKLSYRDSLRGRGEEGFIELVGDEALREWIRASDKLVLFAD
ncbi:Protein scd2/ral3 [Schizosaccharomyces pombe 972h-] [Rhizoctonia solani]|uniref:Protein scd2/ral3 [Schizosaccharomyces pombe 972h-] n=1 Tax=Rhizoctonia solani TaxID=456999 RepID=A0A0K6G5P5_9AGAM|nr:Protein scd2/ral3 [Schizosaccharomyces pombe 972h-] [Rhizoctonia solani]